MNMVDIFMISIKISDKTRIGSGILTQFCPELRGQYKSRTQQIKSR